MAQDKLDIARTALHQIAVHARDLSSAIAVARDALQRIDGELFTEGDGDERLDIDEPISVPKQR